MVNITILSIKCKYEMDFLSWLKEKKVSGNKIRFKRVAVEREFENAFFGK